MSIRVGINGFGRIGRNVLRAIAEAGRNDIEVVGINDLAPVETNAHLLRFDSVHGRFPGEVTVKGDAINIGNGPIKVTAVRDPATLPWRELGVDVALECTGIFTAREKAAVPPARTNETTPLVRSRQKATNAWTMAMPRTLQSNRSKRDRRTIDQSSRSAFRRRAMAA